MTDVALFPVTGPSPELRETNAETTERRLVPAIQYWVAMPQPTAHLFEVTLRVQSWRDPALDLKMPVWTPGSYLVREYARHLQDFRVQASSGQPLQWRKLSKHHWQIDTAGVSEITVHYRIFANELSVRTNHLDATHGYFNGAALFFYVAGFERHPYNVTIVPPAPHWRVTTPLPAVSETDPEDHVAPQIKGYRFLATDFDTLVDSPFEIGIHQLYEFQVLGKSHQLAIWGKGNAEPDRLIEDIQKIIEVEAEMFGGLPYEHYLFLLHLSDTGYGGLEHKFSCSLNYPRFNFRAKEKYDRFLQLVAHEFFHLWNVKRIRPKALEVFDYEAENYTPSLWFSEGTTSYYDIFIPFRAGLYDAKTLFQSLSKEVTRLQMTPGRKVQPASESSWDAWIKLYRRDANSDNNQVSYYLKGEMVSFLLDLLIRAEQGNTRSLDDVLKILWQQFGRPEIGFTPEQLQEVIESVAGRELSDFFARYVEGTDELPFDQYLEPFGLQISTEEVSDLPYLGLTAHSEGGHELVKFVEAGGPAQFAGIDPGDQLLALDQVRVTAEQLSDRLKDYRPGDNVTITVFHGDELRMCQVTLAPPRPNRYQIVAVDRPTPEQQHNFMGWLGVPLTKFVTG